MREQLQKVRHLKLFFPHRNVWHLSVLDWQITIAFWRFCCTDNEVHFGRRRPSLEIHPHEVEENGFCWVNVLPHTHPLWQAHLNGGRNFKSLELLLSKSMKRNSSSLIFSFFKKQTPQTLLIYVGNLTFCAQETLTNVKTTLSWKSWKMMKEYCRYSSQKKSSIFWYW